MIGQWRKCKFCKRKFRLRMVKGILGTQYNFVMIENGYTGGVEYAHKSCYETFIKTRPPKVVSEFKAGFNIKGPYVEGGFRRE